MKTLALMRHSNAVDVLNGNVKHDIERPLSDAGIALLEQALKFLKAHQIKPNYVLCSTATRTKQTLNWVQEALAPEAHIEYEEDMYGADAETLTELLTNLPAEAESVLVIGHNPSISEVSHNLSDNMGAEDVIIKHRHPLTPCQVNVFQLDTNNWDELFSSTGTVSEIFYPPEVGQ